MRFQMKWPAGPLTSKPQVKSSCETRSPLYGAGVSWYRLSMNVHATISLPTTPDEFLAWNQDREGKREFVEGRVVEMMVNTTLGHARLALQLSAFFLTKLPLNEFAVTSSDYGVRTETCVRYPDVLVLKSAEHNSSLATEEPLLIAEILSPSTMAVDFGAKAFEYQAFDSLRHYLILADRKSVV